MKASKTLSIFAAAAMGMTLAAQFPAVVFATEAGTTYDVWVGAAQVTSENAQDVLGDGGSVKFDAETSTLTFDDPQAIPGHYSEPYVPSLIYSEQAITLTGTAEFTYDSENPVDVFLLSVGSNSAITFKDCDFTVSGFDSSVVSNNSYLYVEDGTDLEIISTGGTGGGGYGLAAYRDIVFNGGRTTVTGAYHGAYTANKLQFNGNNTFVTINNSVSEAVIYYNDAILSEDLEIKVPENGYFSNGYLMDSEGTIVKSGKIAPKKLHTVTVNDSENGKATVKYDEYGAGASVDVFVEMDEDYELESLTYTPKDGEPVDITETQTFEMPDADVEINAVFKAVADDSSEEDSSSEPETSSAEDSSEEDTSSEDDTSSSDDTSSDDTSSDADSTGDSSTASSSSSSNSSKSNSSPSNSGSTTTDTNPATGAAAGLSLAVLAMGALVVAKKNK